MRLLLNEKPEGIVHLYDMVATLMGYEDTSNLHYDCTKINVSMDICDDVEEAYRREFEAVSDEWRNAFSMDWLCCGPKADESLPPRTVEVEEGFIVCDTLW